MGSNRKDVMSYEPEQSCRLCHLANCGSGPLLMLYFLFRLSPRPTCQTLNLLQLIKTTTIILQKMVTSPQRPQRPFVFVLSVCHLIYITLIDLLTDSFGHVCSLSAIYGATSCTWLSAPYLINVRFSQFMKLH